MADRGIGFNRPIRLAWLNETARLCAAGLGRQELRARLDAALAGDVASAENRRKTIDILLNIWDGRALTAPALHAAALSMVRSISEPELVFLHYGLTLVRYPFLQATASALGQLCRVEGQASPAALKGRLAAERGQSGSQEKAVQRVLSSLTDWGLVRRRGGYTYTPPEPALAGEPPILQCWLLACALHAHPASELTFADLLRLPELFAFRFTVNVDDLRSTPWLAVQRQGLGWDLVYPRDRLNSG